MTTNNMTTNISERQFEIIEAAGLILTTSGVGGLTIKNLAKEMKFSESAIYRHFTSKEEIIVALLEYLANTMDERFSRLPATEPAERFVQMLDRKSTRLNSSHVKISYAVFCLKK